MTTLPNGQQFLGGVGTPTNNNQQILPGVPTPGSGSTMGNLVSAAINPFPQGTLTNQETGMPNGSPSPFHSLMSQMFGVLQPTLQANGFDNVAPQSQANQFTNGVLPNPQTGQVNFHDFLTNMFNHPQFQQSLQNMIGSIINGK